jgi:hypothetical protein
MIRTWDPDGVAAVQILLCVMVGAALGAAVVADRRARAEAPRQQVLRLDDTQLVAYAFEDGDLVLDFFGGTGRWASYARGVLVSNGRIDDTPAFTVRASTDHVLDLALFEKLARWVEASEPLQVRLEASGVRPLERPTHLELTDGYRSLSVLEPHHA